MAIYGDYQDFDRYLKDYLRGEDAPTAKSSPDLDRKKKAVEEEKKTKNSKKSESIDLPGEEKVAKKVKGILNKMMSQMMRESSAVLDFTTGKVALLDDEDLISVDLSGDKPVFIRNPISSFAKTIPAYAVKVPLSQIQKGEIYVSQNGKVTGFIIGVKDNEIEVIESNGTISRVIQSKNSMTGDTGVFVVRTPFNLGDGAGAGNNLWMLSAMMGGGEDGDGIEGSAMGKLMAMQAMSSMMGGGGASAANPMSIFGGGQGIGGLMTSVMMLEMLEQ